VARGIEESGISTVSATFRRDIIGLVRPPRVLSMKFAPGRPLGNPGDADTQRKIIEAGFKLLQKDIHDMMIVDLPLRLKKFGLF